MEGVLMGSHSKTDHAIRRLRRLARRRREAKLRKDQGGAATAHRGPWPCRGDPGAERVGRVWAHRRARWTRVPAHRGAGRLSPRQLTPSKPRGGDDHEPTHHGSRKQRARRRPEGHQLERGAL